MTSEIPAFFFWAALAGWGISYLVMRKRLKRAYFLGGLCLKAIGISEIIIDVLLEKRMEQKEGNVIPFRRK